MKKQYGVRVVRDGHVKWAGRGGRWTERTEEALLMTYSRSASFAERVAPLYERVVVVNSRGAVILWRGA